MMMDCSPETYPSAMRVCWCNQDPSRLMKRTGKVSGDDFRFCFNRVFATHG